MTNDPITNAANDITTEVVKSALGLMYKPISEFLSVNRAKFFENFESYCNLVYRKCSNLRTLYAKSKAVSIDELYIETHFEQDGHRYPDEELLEFFAEGRRLVIKGNGGSGKTIFMKYLWIERFRCSEGKIPIFVELRPLNDLNHIDLATFCRNELQSDMSFGDGVFDKLCAAGKFEFIFDGFDEINRAHRKTVERQILSLSEQYRDCSFLVSGREDDRFTSWGNFEIYSVAPLRIENVK